MQAAAATPRFGTVQEISGTDFVREVTEASAAYWVVVFLYKSSHAGCQLLQSCLEDLAHKYPMTKFVKIVSTSCIPNYPDYNLPTILLYHSNACKKHLVGLEQFGGRHVTPEQVALVLNAYGQVCGEGDEQQTAAQQIKGLVERMVARREEEQEGESVDL